MKINIHSFVDVITNSSTTIFVTMNGGAIKGMHSVIDEILKVAKSDKKSEDLFDISIDRDWDDIIESWFEDYANEPEDPKEKEMYDQRNALEYKEFSAYAEKVVIPYLKENNIWQKYTEDWNGFEKDSWLVVKSKTGDDTKEIWGMINRLFSADGYRDG